MTGRGRPARLSRDAVIGAAERIVRAEGSAALSMRRLARELGSSPMALYRHVDDKDDLLRQLLDRIAAQLRRPDPPRAPRERVLAVGRAVHTWLRVHTWAIDVLPAHLMGWSTAWIVDDIVGALMAGGLPPEDAARGYTAVWRYIVGELTLAHSEAAVQAAAPPAPAPEEAVHHDLPALRAVQEHWPQDPDDAAFAHGLAALVAGLLAR